VLFLVSAFTKKTDAAKLKKATIDWSAPRNHSAVWSDWRLHFAVLMAVTVAAYWCSGNECLLRENCRP